jgi:hypothetical protein
MTSSHPHSQLQVIRHILRTTLGADLVSTTAIDGGFGGGSIYRSRMRFAGQSLERVVIVKLSTVQGTRIVADDDVDARIYGARSWSLAPVHALLRERGLPTYDLLGHGFPSADVPYAWVVMSSLDGVPVRGCDGAPDPDAFHRVCGEALGALHAVTRPYDGAVDRDEPHRMAWTDAFFQSLEHALQRVLAQGDPNFCRHEAEIRTFIDARRIRWVPPHAYVLSHPDGLQGHALRDRTRWRFVGHLDLEDFSFTDARFPLAGYELGAAGSVPPAFWEGYRAFQATDASDESVRGLFTLYFLLDWFWIVFDPRLTPATTRSQSIDRHTNAILRTMRGSSRFSH